jgi:preprotein translocase subunit SecE
VSEPSRNSALRVVVIVLAVIGGIALISAVIMTLMHSWMMGGL